MRCSCVQKPISRPIASGFLLLAFHALARHDHTGSNFVLGPRGRMMCRCPSRRTTSTWNFWKPPCVSSQSVLVSVKGLKVSYAGSFRSSSDHHLPPPFRDLHSFCLCLCPCPSQICSSPCWILSLRVVTSLAGTKSKVGVASSPPRVWPRRTCLTRNGLSYK